MTMDTDDATDRNSAPITPNWMLDISPMKKEEKIGEYYNKNMAPSPPQTVATRSLWPSGVAAVAEEGGEKWSCLYENVVGE